MLNTNKNRQNRLTFVYTYFKITHMPNYHYISLPQQNGDHSKIIFISSRHPVISSIYLDKTARLAVYLTS